MSSLLDELDAAQRMAVQCSSRAVLVVAGPGSGKTRVITRRIAFRIENGGVPPHRILAVTFTNRAAREMGTRVRALLGEDVPVPIGTFHWMCAGILRRYAHLLGYRRSFRLLTPTESRHVLRAAYGDESRPESASIGRLAEAISGLKSGADMARVVAEGALNADRLRRLLGLYTERLRRADALDLDDLPALACRLLRDHPGVRHACRSAIDELLVDEYQDTSPVQQELVALLAPERGSVVVVGDEDQAIYGWRHADGRGPQRFLERFPEARVITLDHSFRHTKHILRASSALIEHNRGRMPKQVRTERHAGERPVCYAAVDEQDEAAWVAGELSRLATTRGLPWHEMAVLFRVNAQSRALEDALIRSSVPYRVLSGRSFYLRPHVRRALAYLRLAADDDDASLELLLSGVSGIGARRLGVLRAGAEERGVSLFRLVSEYLESTKLPRSVQASAAVVVDRVHRVRTQRRGSVVSVVNEAIAAVNEELDAEGLDSEAARDDLEELRSVARTHHGGRGTLRSLTDTLTLDSAAEETKNGVNLVSLHAAKGLEFSAVFLVGLEEGLLPHRRSLERADTVEEERRLCYVGMTRARDWLSMSYAQTRLLSGHGVSGQASRFLAEMGLQHITMRVSPSRHLKPRLLHVNPGDRVSHPRWGAGTVERVEGKGRDTLATIQFDGAGRQRLQLCHAPLSLLTEGASDVLAG